MGKEPVSFYCNAILIIIPVPPIYAGKSVALKNKLQVLQSKSVSINNIMGFRIRIKQTELCIL
jgi:hypothetical protein